MTDKHIDLEELRKTAGKPTNVGTLREIISRLGDQHFTVQDIRDIVKNYPEYKKFADLMAKKTIPETIRTMRVAGEIEIVSSKNGHRCVYRAKQEKQNERT